MEIIYEQTKQNQLIDIVFLSVFILTKIGLELILIKTNLSYLKNVN